MSFEAPGHPEPPRRRENEAQQFANQPIERPRGSRAGQNRALIAVCGMTGSGKSTFIQQLSGRLGRVGHSLHSETSRIEEVACMIDDRSVTLIDTPGFDDTVLSEHEVLTILTDWLETAFVSGTRLSGIIYLHDITNVRMTSSSIRTLTLFRKLCGDESLSNVLLVSNRWEVCDRSLAAQRQEQLVSDGSFWATLLACGARAHRYRNTRAEAVALVKILLKKPPVALKIQKELVEEGKPLAETNAGAFVHREIVRLKEYHHEELAALREEIARAQRSGNEELQRHMRNEHERIFEKFQKLQQSNAQLLGQISQLQQQQHQSALLVEALLSENEKAARIERPRSIELEAKRIERQQIEQERRDRIIWEREQLEVEWRTMEQRWKEQREEEQREEEQRESERLEREWLAREEKEMEQRWKEQREEEQRESERLEREWLAGEERERDERERQMREREEGVREMFMREGEKREREERMKKIDEWGQDPANAWFIRQKLAEMRGK